jgi:hypothetical protein
MATMITEVYDALKEAGASEWLSGNNAFRLKMIQSPWCKR